MQLGTDVHGHVEHRLLNGIWKPVEETDKYDLKTLRIAMSNEHLLPDEKIEKKWVEASLRIGAGTNGIKLPVIGFIDWLEPFNNRINDHKTQSDSRWSLSEMELRRDPQAIIYGKFALLRYPTVFDQPNIKFRHIYYPTTSRSRPDTTEITLSLREIDEGFAAIVERTEMMVVDATCEEVKDVLPNTAACGDYGGCPFRGHCEVVGDLGEFNPFEAFEHTDTGAKKMGLFDKIKAKKADKSGINPPQEEKPKVKESERPVLTKEELLAEFRKCTAGEIAAFQMIPKGGQRWIMREVKAGSKFLVAVNQAIHKLSKREGSKELVAKIIEAMHTKSKGTAPKKKVKKVKKVKNVEVNWAELAKDQMGSENLPQKQFERNTSDNPLENYTVGDALKATEETVVVVEDAPNVNTHFGKRPKEYMGLEHSYLFVDSMPRHATVAFFDEWIKPLVEQVLKQHRARHYMLPPLDYGKGKAEIQCALSAWLRSEGNRLPLKMHICRRHALADVFIAETADMWHEIVEG